MDIYTRRRAIAAGIVCGVLASVVVLAVAIGVGGEQVGAKGKAIGGPKPPPALVADPPSSHVKLPNRVIGEGPFMTIEGRTVQSRDVPSPGRKVALTFDDGPVPLTAQFLDKLDKLNVKASFFVLGLQVGAHPEIARRQNEMGMTVANHTYGHKNLPQLSPRDQRTEIVRTQGMIDEAIGRRAYFFRFPGQDWDFASARQMAQRGMVGVRFSIDTQDWRGRGRQEIVRSALEAKPGSVIQLHDGGPNREATLAAVGPIVRGLRKRGFELVTLDELYRPVTEAKGRRSRSKHS